MAGRPTKYTYEYCLKEIKSIHTLLFADGATDSKIKYFTWHDLIRERPYSRQRISEWREKYKEHRVFSDTLKKIDEEFENRTYKYALLNKVNPTIAIFSLKNNYGWKDKHESEVIGIPQSINLIVDNSETAETLKKLKDEFSKII